MRKMRVQTSLKFPLITHATENWTTTNNDEIRLSIFERKMLRKMYVERDKIEI